MKQLIQPFAMAFFFLGASTNLSAQVDYPYNPDVDGDGFIAVVDLFEFLSVFGGNIVPPELLVDSIPLGTYLEILQESIVHQSVQLDSLENALYSPTTPPKPTEYDWCYENQSYFMDCVNEKIADGWWAFGGASVQNSFLVQAFVKY